MSETMVSGGDTNRRATPTTLSQVAPPSPTLLPVDGVSDEHPRADDIFWGEAIDPPAGVRQARASDGGTSEARQ